MFINQFQFPLGTWKFLHVCYKAKVNIISSFHNFLNGDCKLLVFTQASYEQLT